MIAVEAEAAEAVGAASLVSLVTAVAVAINSLAFGAAARYANEVSGALIGAGT